jgi:hypothetical protein
VEDRDVLGNIIATQRRRDPSVVDADDGEVFREQPAAGVTAGKTLRLVTV